MISISFLSHEVRDLLLDDVINSVPRLISEEGKETGEVSIILCTDEELLAINQKHLQHDFFTDIISFDYSSGSYIAGDLYVSYERIRDNAAIFNTAEDEEFRRVVFHGVLHLLGYNDKTDEEKTVMTEKENHYLAKLFHVKH